MTREERPPTETTVLTIGVATKKPAEEENKAGNATTSAGLAATSATGKKGKGATGLTSSTKNGTNFQDKEGKFELLHTGSATSQVTAQKADHIDDEQLVTLIEALTGINIGIIGLRALLQLVSCHKESVTVAAGAETITLYPSVILTQSNT
ncbi:hypothetical protein PZA11_004724 [Diplocarpon coronariae]